MPVPANGLGRPVQFGKKHSAIELYVLALSSLTPNAGCMASWYSPAKARSATYSRSMLQPVGVDTLSSCQQVAAVVRACCVRCAWILLCGVGLS